MSSGAVAERTNSLGLAILNFGFPNWGDEANNNQRIIDAAFAYFGVTISGAWSNSTNYTAGQLVVDPDENALFRVMVTHTSAASGSFLDDRTAHPTYWDEAVVPFNARGAWTTATAYNANDIAYEGYKWVIAVQAHTSAALLATDITNGKMVVIMDGTSTVADSVSAKNAAQAAAVLTAADAASADADATATAADRVAVAADKATVAADKATVSVDKGTVAADKATVAADKATVAADKTAADASAIAAAASAASATLSAAAAAKFVFNARLTTVSGTPVTAGDSTQGTLFLTPYNGNTIALYDGANWNVHTLTEISILVGLTGTASRPHDVFVYNNAGTLTLELVAWTDDTTRATTLTTQDGVYVKSGATTQRFAGSVYLDGSKQCADTAASRHLWNCYNRVDKRLRVIDTTDSWTYSTLTCRQARASTANQISLMVGLNEDAVHAHLQSSFTSSTVSDAAYGLIGLDSTTTKAAGSIANLGRISTTAIMHQMTCVFDGNVGIGKHILTWLEQPSIAGGTLTWRGDAGTTGVEQSGITGIWRC